MRLNRRIIFFLAALIASHYAHAEAWDIEHLMAALGSHREGHARFVETTYLKMLERPVESSGELTFMAPDQLRKLTLKPKREELTLTGNELSIERKGRQRVLQLSDYPQIAVFIDSIRGTLMGDRAALERAYQLSLSGIEQQWNLLLTPKDRAAAIDRIAISGNNGNVVNVEIVQADGDRSVMRIDNFSSDDSRRESAP